MKLIIVRPDGKEPVEFVLPSDRELEIISLVAAALMDKEIADRLHIALSTVRSHFARICESAGLRNRTEMCLWFLTNLQLMQGHAARVGLHPEGCQCQSVLCVALLAALDPVDAVA